jgi:hypothetical protein
VVVEGIALVKSSDGVGIVLVVGVACVCGGLFFLCLIALSDQSAFGILEEGPALFF